MGRSTSGARSRIQSMSDAETFAVLPFTWGVPHMEREPETTQVLGDDDDRAASAAVDGCREARAGLLERNRAPDL